MGSNSSFDLLGQPREGFRVQVLATAGPTSLDSALVMDKLACLLSYQTGRWQHLSQERVEDGIRLKSPVLSILPGGVSTMVGAIRGIIF